MTGGGTGGHITPLLAVAEELKRIHPGCEVIYVGEKNSKFGELTKAPLFDATNQVSAGKFRRYHSTKWYEKLLDVRTIALNLRDVFRVGWGLIESWRLLGRIKPDVVFLKGGYVGVPVGLAAATRGLPIVTHDSDAIPGLANRVVGRWAAKHAVALAPENYAYPQEKTEQVGVLVEQSYQPVTEKMLREYREELSIPTDAIVLLVTGGSSGARAINDAMVRIAPELLEKHPKLMIIHQTGKGKAGCYGEFAHERLQVLEFLRPMASYMGAADLVICRGSANTIAELAVQGKAAIVIPSPYLANGHQLENAAILAEQGSAAVVQESEIYDSETGLQAVTSHLITDTAEREKLGEKLAQTAPTNAAEKVAQLIIDQVEMVGS